VAELLSELLIRCKKGEHGAMELLVERYKDGAYRLARALTGDEHLAEDAVQEAFIQALAKLGQLRDPEAFAGWLRRIVRTACGRLTRKRRESLAETAISGAAAGDGPLDGVAKDEVAMLIRQSIDGLSEATRETARLFYLDELDQATVAGMLGVPEGTVRRRLHDSRRQLREMLTWYFEEGEAAERPAGPEKII
jgi:RNA polymerase sigma-70 factor (ECF subfamily)